MPCYEEEAMEEEEEPPCRRRPPRPPPPPSPPSPPSCGCRPPPPPPCGCQQPPACTPTFVWSSITNVKGNTATGTIGDFSFTYTELSQESTTNTPLETTSDVAGHSKFPAKFNIPNTTSIKNTENTNNTLTFSNPMKDPILVFASIGSVENGNRLTIPISFSSPVTLLWQENVTVDSPKQISGTEGFAVVKMPGTFSSLTFHYMAPEAYCNFLFGAYVPCGVDPN